MSIDINTELLLLPLEVLNLEVRTCRTLKRGGVLTLEDIVNFGESNLAKIYQLGPKRVTYVIKEFNEFMLKAQGKTLSEFLKEQQKPYLYESSPSVKPNLLSFDIKMSGVRSL